MKLYVYNLVISILGLIFHGINYSDYDWLEKIYMMNIYMSILFIVMERFRSYNKIILEAVIINRELMNMTSSDENV